MSKYFIILFFLAFEIFFASCVPTPPAKKFSIDNSVSNYIDSTFKESVLIKSSERPEFAFHVANNFDYKKFGINGMDLPYLLNGSIDINHDYVNSYSECYLSKDTIVLLGALVYSSGIVFKILIYGDKYDCQLGLSADDSIYSKRNSKNKLEKEIILDADSSSMALTQKPQFKTGSIIKGKVKLKPELFYQLDSTKIPSPIKADIDIIFDAPIGEKEKD